MSALPLVILSMIAVVCYSSPPQYAYEYIIKDPGNHHDGSYINRKVAIRYIGGGIEKDSSSVHHPDKDSHSGVSEQRQEIIRNGLDDIGSGIRQSGHISRSLGGGLYGNFDSLRGYGLVNRGYGGYNRGFGGITAYRRFGYDRRGYGDYDGYGYDRRYRGHGFDRRGYGFDRRGYGVDYQRFGY